MSTPSWRRTSGSGTKRPTERPRVAPTLLRRLPAVPREPHPRRLRTRDVRMRSSPSAVGVALVWGFFMVADSAQFAAHAVGRALRLQISS
jgi:hypothetical protein